MNRLILVAMVATAAAHAQDPRPLPDSAATLSGAVPLVPAFSTMDIRLAYLRFLLADYTLICAS